MNHRPAPIPPQRLAPLRVAAGTLLILVGVGLAGFVLLVLLGLVAGPRVVRHDYEEVFTDSALGEMRVELRGQSRPLPGGESGERFVGSPYHLIVELTDQPRDARCLPALTAKVADGEGRVLAESPVARTTSTYTAYYATKVPLPPRDVVIRLEFDAPATCGPAIPAVSVRMTWREVHTRHTLLDVLNTIT